MIKKTLLLGFTAFCLVGFVLLGNWQLERRVWKLDLIAQLDAQLAKTAVAAPGPELWPQLDEGSAYRPVTVRGQFNHQQETLVQAMTKLGSGYWVLTPLTTDAGFDVLVNRGFVDAARRHQDSRIDSQVTGVVEVTGLLRLSEPNHRTFQRNQPQADRWYSRDVAAIGEKRGLAAERLAPYFIDANNSDAKQAWPVAGLTVVAFRNSHLSYAITWYSLALLCFICALIILRHRPQERGGAS